MAPKHGITVALGLGASGDHKMTEADGDDDAYDEGHVTDEEKEAGSDVKSALDSGDGESIALALKHFWDLCEKEEGEEPEEKE